MCTYPQRPDLPVCCLKSVAGTALAAILLHLVQAAWPVKLFPDCLHWMPLVRLLCLHFSYLQYSTHSVSWPELGRGVQTSDCPLAVRSHRLAPEIPHMKAAASPLLQCLVPAVGRPGQGGGVHASVCHRAGHSSRLGAQIPPHQEAGCAGVDAQQTNASLLFMSVTVSVPHLTDGAVAGTTPPLQLLALWAPDLVQRFVVVSASRYSSALHAQLLYFGKVLPFAAVI